MKYIYMIYTVRYKYKTILCIEEKYKYVKYGNNTVHICGEKIWVRFFLFWMCCTSPKSIKEQDDHIIILVSENVYTKD
jgi:hypothetical protein